MKKNMNNSFLKVGFIGSGRMASEHVKVIKSFKKYQCTSILSKSIKNAKNFSIKHKIKNFYSDIDLFLKFHKYDLVILCVPPTEKLLILKKLFMHNLNIFIEKPLGLNFLESKLIVTLYKKRKFKKTKIFVGYNRRFLGSVLKMNKLITHSSGIRIIKIQDQQDLKKAKIMGHNKKTLKYWMYANCIHTVDFFNFLGRGKILKIVNCIKFSKDKPIVSAKIFFSSGDIGIYVCFWNRQANWSVFVSTVRKSFLLSPLEKLKVFDKSGIVEYKEFFNEKKFKPGLYSQFLEIDKSMRKLKNKTVNINEAFKSVVIINKIYDGF